jgi:hypothetical protein
MTFKPFVLEQMIETYFPKNHQHHVSNNLDQLDQFVIQHMLSQP